MDPETTSQYEGFDRHDLGGQALFTGHLPSSVIPSKKTFDTIWRLHPENRPKVRTGKRIRRWQQAYAADYRFSGQTAKALPTPGILKPFAFWARANIDERLNALLVNWYDPEQEDHISPHNDDTRDLVPGAPILTISLGGVRSFQLSRSRQKRPFSAEPGSVFVIPWTTNKAWKHGVPHREGSERRISITVRSHAEVRFPFDQPSVFSRF